MIKELKLTKRRKLLGAVVICVALITSSTIFWQMSQVAEAAILAGPYDFYDNFNSDLSQWTVVDGVWVIENGELSGETSALGQRIMMKELTLHDFTGEYNVKFISAVHYEIGLVFRGVSGDEPNNCYWVGLKKQGLFLHERKTESYTLGSYSFSPVLDTVYTVKVEAKGEALKVWLNGMLRIEASNPDFTSGTIGFMAWSYSSEHAHFDDVKISSAGPIPLVPSTYSANVRAGVTQITVTCTWSSSGSITIKLVSPITTYEEPSMNIYEKSKVSFDGTTSANLNIKRATLFISPPTFSETWTLQLDLAGVTTYEVSIEST